MLFMQKRQKVCRYLLPSQCPQVFIFKGQFHVHVLDYFEKQELSGYLK